MPAKVESFREKMIRKGMTTCRHFTGIQHDTCKAGVNYEQLRGESHSLPCLANFVNLGRLPKAECDKFATLTEEEAIREADETVAISQRTMLAMTDPHKDERARFEKWAAEKLCLDHGDLRRDDLGHYKYQEVWTAWLAWQAALSAEPIAPTRYVCTECGSLLTANPMEGHEYSWMHFDGPKNCKLRGKGSEYKSRTAAVRDSEKEGGTAKVLAHERCPKCGNYGDSPTHKFCAAPAPADLEELARESLTQLIIAGIRLAIMRWDLRDEEGMDLSDEECAEIAKDAAWACQGEGTCDENPIPEWTAVAALLRSRGERKEVEHGKR